MPTPDAPASSASSRTHRSIAQCLIPFANVPPDRLPTVSASDALLNLHARGSRAISTGLTQLDRLLSPQGLPGRNVQGGLVRGKVTEVYGPSGAGKTAFG